MMKFLFKVLVPLGILAYAVLLISCSYNDKKLMEQEVDGKTKDSLQFYWSRLSVKDQGNLSEAIRWSKKAIRLANARGSISDQALTYMLSGTIYLVREPDSCYLFNNLALSLARKNSKDTIMQKIYYSLAYLNYYAFNYNESLILLDSAINRSKNAHDKATEVNAMILIGHIDRDQYNNPQARIFYTKALKIAEENNMDLQKGVLLGNLGSIAENNDSAIFLIRKAIAILSTLKSSKEELCTMLMNLSNFIPSKDSAILYYYQAIAYAQSENLTELLIAANNNLGCTYLELNNTKLASQCFLDHAIPLALKTNNLDWLSTVYESCAELYEMTGDFKNAHFYQKMALKSRIEASQKQALNQTRLLNALLMAKNRELDIKVKSDEIRDRKDQLRILLISIIALFLLASVATLYFLWKIQRKNLKIKTQEIETARRLAMIEEKENERLSMQLHDAIRPLTSVLVKQIESIPFSDYSLKESLLNKIKESARQLRHISHRLNPVMRQQMTFSELVRSTIEDFSNDDRLKVNLSLPGNEPCIEKEAVYQLYFIIQELLMNATKYVKEGVIQLGFEEDFDHFYLFYKDNGPGFNKAGESNAGLGIMHIMERAKLMNGTASVDSEPGKGTSWIVTVPSTNCKKKDYDTRVGHREP